MTRFANETKRKKWKDLLPNLLTRAPARDANSLARARLCAQSSRTGWQFSQVCYNFQERHFPRFLSVYSELIFITVTFFLKTQLCDDG